MQLDSSGAIYFKISLDNNQLKADVIQADNIMKRVGDSAARESSRVDSYMKNIGRGIAAAFTLNTANQFISQVVRVRGEIQALESSFTTLLGSKSKGDAMLAEIRKYAVETPYSLSDVSKSAQTMLAFNIEAEKVIPTLKQIGDVAMGDGQKMQSLVLAFSQMSSTGRLMGQDLLQMINAGFNPLVQISERTGESLTKLKKKMEDGKISVEMVAQAFTDATSEGGKFYGMMEQQAGGIQGSLAGLEDAWLNFYNEIGEKSEGLIVDSIQGLTSLIENYREVGRVLAEIVATYGVYRASLITIEALHRVSIALTAQWAIVQRAAAISQVSLNTAQIAGTVATRGLNSAFAALNATLMVNPFVLAAAGIAGLAFSIYKMVSATTEAEKAHKKLSKAHADSMAGYNNEARALDNLYSNLSKAEKGTKEYTAAKNAIMNKYGTQISQLQGENREVWDLSKAYGELKNQALAAAQARALTTYTNDASDQRNKSINDLGNDLLKELEKTYGKDRAFSVFGNIMRLVNTGSEIPENFLSAFDKQQGARGMGVGQMNVGAVENRTRAIINQMTQTQKRFDDAIKNANAMFPAASMLLPEVASPNKPTEEKELTDAEKKRLANEAARLKKETAERAQRIQEMSEQISAAVAQGELDISQAKINAMDEGFEKEMAQIDLNYIRMQAENEKRLQDALEKERDRQQLLWENDPKNRAAIKRGEIFKRDSYTMLQFLDENPDFGGHYEEWIRVIASIREKAEMDATRAIEIDKEKKARETADNIATHSIRLRNLDYQSELNKIDSKTFNFESDKERQKLLLELSKLEGEYKDLTEAQDEYIASLKRLQERQSTDNSKKLAEEIKSTEQAISGVNLELKEAEINIEAVAKKIQKLDNAKLIEGLNNYSRIARSLSGTGGELGEFFAKLADELETMSVLLSEGASDFEKYAAAAQAVAGTINSIISASKNRKAVEDDFERNRLEFAQRYALALNEQLRLQTALAGNGFVRNYSGEITDAFAAMSNAAEEYNKAMLALEDGQVKTGTKRKVDWGSVATGAGTGAMYGANAGPWGAAIGAVVGGVVGLFSGMNRVDVYDDLLKTYPDLIDAEGELRIARAQALIDSGLLDDKTKLLVQNALDWKEANDAAREQISSIVNELAGDLGNSLRDALVDAWKAGEDASERMFAAANKSLANFVQNFLYSTIFSGIFDKFKERLTAALGGSGEDILDIYDDLLDESLVGGETFNKLLDEFQKRALERGFDISGSTDTRTGTNKGFTAMSQQTGEELNGRFTAIQGHTFSMMGSLNEIRIDMKAVHAQSAQALQHLSNIDTSTQVLPMMRDEMRTMRIAIETISERGVKML